MDLLLQAIVLGVVQGLAEFLPISSTGHLVLIPQLLGWRDPFIDSLAFRVMLHLGTLIALLVYFWREWLVLVPAGLAAIRDRSLAGDPQRKLAWLIVVTVIPGGIIGALGNDFFETVTAPAIVALFFVVGAVILWAAERWGSKQRDMEELGFAGAFGIGLAQAIALLPGISRSGISISAGLFAGLERESATRFSFLMSAPIIAGAVVFEGRKLFTHEAGVRPETSLLVAGVVAALLAGLLAIRFMLGYLRSHSLDLFVAYRIVAAAAIVVWLLRP
ncbi:MAG TPA: undecaprenyl-diphosphate phosphatase [Candidatus Limnocylindrales bacterium]